MGKERMQKFSSRMDLVLFCKNFLKNYKKKIFIFRPAISYISPSATVKVTERFSFNKQWDSIRIHRNKIVGSLLIYDNAHLSVGDFTCYAGSRVTVNNNAELILHRGFINYDSVIECFDRIEIGEGCSISERVIIRDSNTHSIDRDDYRIKAPIIIGNHVWIGMGATILPGVAIGDGAVIAAGAVVTKNIPPHTLAAGVPAKVIRENVQWH